MMMQESSLHRTLTKEEIYKTEDVDPAEFKRVKEDARFLKERIEEDLRVAQERMNNAEPEKPTIS